MAQSGQSPIKIVVFVIYLLALYAVLQLSPNPWVTLAAIWLVTMTLPYVLGPILMRRTQWTGMDETSEPADLGGNEVPNDVAVTYRFVDRELAKLGFERRFSYLDRGRAPNATAYLAMYTNGQTKEVARFIASVSENARATVRNFAPILTYLTQFADGTEVHTVNGRAPRYGPRLGPPAHAFDFPEVGEVDRLLGLHRALVRRFEGGRLRVEPVGSDPAGFQRRANRRYHEMVIAQGYFHPDEEHRVLRLTWKGAFLITWPLLWPIKAMISASRKARSARLIRQLESEGRDDGFRAHR